MKQHAFKSRSLGHLLLIVLMGLLFTLAGPGAALANGTFTVNSSGDGNTSDAFLTLREAIALANGGTGGTDGLGRTLTNGEKAQISGGCTFGGGDNDWTITGGCGAGVFDTILFDPAITQVDLTEIGVLPITDNGTWVDGRT